MTLRKSFFNFEIGSIVLYTPYAQMEGVMGSVPKHKHLVLDQRTITVAKRYFRVDSDQEAIDKALSLLVEEERFSKRLRSLKGVLKGDKRPWPYQ